MDIGRFGALVLVFCSVGRVYGCGFHSLLGQNNFLQTSLSSRWSPAAWSSQDSLWYSDLYEAVRTGGSTQLGPSQCLPDDLINRCINPDGSTLLTAALFKGFLDTDIGLALIISLLKSGAHLLGPCSKKPLLSADSGLQCKICLPVQFKKLRQEGRSLIDIVDWCDPERYGTILHLIARYGCGIDYRTEVRLCIDDIEILVGAGVDLTVRDNTGKTCIDYLVERGLLVEGIGIGNPVLGLFCDKGHTGKSFLMVQGVNCKPMKLFHQELKPSVTKDLDFLVELPSDFNDSLCSKEFAVLSPMELSSEDEMLDAFDKLPPVDVGG